MVAKHQKPVAGKAPKGVFEIAGREAGVDHVPITRGEGQPHDPHRPVVHENGQTELSGQTFCGGDNSGQTVFDHGRRRVPARFASKPAPDSIRETPQPGYVENRHGGAGSGRQQE